jgi:hypothetical protein
MPKFVEKSFLSLSQFPHLIYQKRIVEKSLKRQTLINKKQTWTEEVLAERKRLGLVSY